MMRILTRTLLLLAFVLAPLEVRADEQPLVVIKDSTSPDGSKDLVFAEHDTEVGLAAGNIQIREISTGKILGSCSWDSGLLEHVYAETFGVLWRPDSRAFALKWEGTRGFMVSGVYLCTKAGWTEVAMPDFCPVVDRWVHKLGHRRYWDNRLHSNGHGHETALKWLSDNGLQMEICYRGLYTLDAKGRQHDALWLTVIIPRTTTKLESRAVIKAIGFAPSSEYSVAWKAD